MIWISNTLNEKYFLIYPYVSTNNDEKIQDFQQAK